MNNRFLDVNLRLPNELLQLEQPIRKQIGDSVARGRVEVNLQIDREENIEYELNRPLISGYLAALSEMREEFGLAGEPDINVIARLPNVMSAKRIEANAGLADAASLAVEMALNDLDTMRSAEGALLSAELGARLDTIARILPAIESEASTISEEYRERLNKRIGEMLAKTDSQIEIDQGRLAQEVAYLSDRADISEEVARLKAHIEHFRTIMSEKKEVGKRLDFLTQELNREANTIASKTNNMIVKEAALTIKGEIEKIREQIQNVE